MGDSDASTCSYLWAYKLLCCAKETNLVLFLSFVRDLSSPVILAISKKFHRKCQIPLNFLPTILFPTEPTSNKMALDS